jgi:hypothetical protein
MTLDNTKSQDININASLWYIVDKVFYNLKTIAHEYPTLPKYLLSTLRIMRGKQ